jgi:transcriptional regulator GlxA family with amidase domain
MFGATAVRPLTIGFLLVPNFSMMAFASAVEPLRSANRQAGEELYRWRLFSADGAPVAASNGIAVMPHGSIRDAEPLGMAIVCAGIDVERYGERSVFAWLRRLASAGCDVGALSTGAYVLARAGLLDGRRCALHWENAPAFAEAFPNVSVSSEIFVIDGNRFTCSGGTAALDMMLYLIKAQHGHALATAVSEQFIHGQMRDHDDPSACSCGRASASPIPSCWPRWRRWNRMSKRRARLRRWRVRRRSRRASSNGCSASISAARRRSTISKCGWRVRASS